MDEEFQRSISLTHQDESLLAGQISLDVEILDSKISHNRVPKLRITATNLSEEKIRVFSGLWPIFGTARSEELNPGLLILPTQYYIELDSSGFPVQEDFYFDSIDVANVLEGHGETSQDFIICNYPDNAKPFPAGNYSFSNEYRFYSFLNEDTVENETDMRWGFDIRID